MSETSAHPVGASKAPVIGVGLNKTGTKSLRSCMTQWGYQHHMGYSQAFAKWRENDIDGLLQLMSGCDSFEDWPWPLAFREIDAHLADARFVLTVRSSPQVWFQSLCKMAVRIGPHQEFDNIVYGFSMPQGHKAEHIAFYEAHNAAVREHFVDRPNKLLELCWDEQDAAHQLADFLGEAPIEKPHANRSRPVYGGDNLLRAHAHRIAYQWPRRLKQAALRVRG